MNFAELKAELVEDEGYKKFPYKDSVGKLTIGVGHNLTDRGLSAAAIEFILDEDVAEAERQLNFHLPWWKDQPEPVQRALLNLCFNMGIKTLLTFKVTLAQIKAGSYFLASDNLLKSKYAKQVGDRALRVAALIRKGAKT